VGEAVQIGHVNDDVRLHPRVPEGEGGEDLIVGTGKEGQSLPCSHCLQTSRAQGQRGEGRAKGCHDLEEGGEGGGRRRRNGAACRQLAGKITNKHLVTHVSGEGVVSKTSVDQEEDLGDRR
jgi:hypothetical protein